ncbi:Transposon Ty3-I Gag-Pol polyprotein [Araneus ventricosus]|uniref:Transposon Ty3-I Gag-Pol polyprotein n=1 Tax=Araneus ventricosus TaxID=182803 RepID=A0A4Y2IQH0_ARAVE|nr:Transposon Ty3-I Gag-Pol polyprotein [Araneus ventricosus]
MVDNGIIEESSGPWTSPIVLVKKKDGSTRFCVDYRKLNEITIKDSYPLLRIDDTLDALNGSQWFSTLDLKSGYWQVEIQPEDKEKTPFTTGQGLWNFSAIARPLHKLTEARTSFNWTEECEKSFNSLKQALITSPILTYPRTDKEFILDTDASNEGTGAVLSQKIGNEECVIAYFSKSLEFCRPTGKAIETYEELPVAPFSPISVENMPHNIDRMVLSNDQQYLYDICLAISRVECYSDLAIRKPVAIAHSREPEGQIARWIQRLQEYDFEIQHRKGTSHGNADALSRRPCKESCKHCTNAEKKFGMETDISVKVLTTEDAWSSSEVQKAQIEDPAIRPILEKKINSEDRPSWQEIAPESPATKLYWALWDSLHL